MDGQHTSLSPPDSAFLEKEAGGPPAKASGLRFLANKLGQRTIWRRIVYERFTEPIHLNLLSLPVLLVGSFRQKVEFDLIPRHEHAFGLLRAADMARELGLKAVTAIEFGVAHGSGLLNICELARRITRVTGVAFHVYGFDSGTGMPPPRDYRDHPELYTEGDFPMDREALMRRLPHFAKIIFGDLSGIRTLASCGVSPEAPVGFASVDVDYYWSAREALALFTANPELYLPLTTMYFDDIALESHNPFCGEYLAIDEFNRENERRKIAKCNFLKKHRIFKNARWLDQMYTLHVLDHPWRSIENRSPERRVLANPYF